MKMRFVPLLLILLIISSTAISQSLENFGISASQGLKVRRYIMSDSSLIDSEDPHPLFSFELNGKLVYSDDVKAGLEGTRFVMIFEESLKVTYASFGGGHPGWRGEIIFENLGFDTLDISNVLLFGERSENVYITGNGPGNQARALLHIPGRLPVRVILPDNAWEAGYNSQQISNNLSIAGLARRGKSSEAILKRYNTLLPPRAKIAYELYGDTYKGVWQNGLKLIFRDRYMYDLYDFDNSLFEREDLMWIRKSYLIMIQFAWDKSFYDRFSGKYNYGEVIRETNRMFGFSDVYGVWPTWPRIGIDSRNQCDLYSDLPGGTEQLRSFARLSRQYGTRFFIAYNPWDIVTRTENPYSEMARLIGETEADGVVLNTRGNSGYELQSAADSVREGVIMYSEGMAVIKDMPGIISGRVNNAIFMAPELNLNKLIKPDYAIFRVLDVGEAPLHREIAIAFFNGYGSELNMLRPNRDFQIEKDFDLLGRTTMILRENSDAFLDQDWTPLIETTVDNVYVNRWQSETKTIFTILNLDPKGVEIPLFRTNIEAGYHYVSLWNYEDIEPVRSGSRWLLPIKADPFSESYSQTRLEGSVDCIAKLPSHLTAGIEGRNIRIATDLAGSVIIWRGEPSYQGVSKSFGLKGDTLISRESLFGSYEGKIVIQLFSDNQLSDMSIVRFSGVSPWLVSETVKTPTAVKTPKNMLLVAGASFRVNLTSNEGFIPYPENSAGEIVEVDSFLIDKFPVTNEEYYRFVMETGYSPSDTLNYLRHWLNGLYKQGQEKYPVVFISYEDAKAYADWAKKRLPTEMEWQLAGQGTDGRTWPWGDEFHGTKCNNAFERPTPVDAFSKGQSPYGVYDMVGNIWQLTNDIYDNGINYFVIIRGGSYYNPASSSWYVKGGPQPLNRTQMMPMVSQGFDRNSTVGFRCVKDINRD